ncbi:MAG: methylated-DNA--[Thermoguttaceae bacterium]|nr:methylated-DNA--[protein]-cysteine S-methyltransferase [Thermoguttaceae bacterium]MBR0193526.1 methylated-DNA--[protein]-cysteine S-methyltransferase [Thermoguttaceae bacterium]
MVYSSPIGPIFLRESNGFLVSVHFSAEGESSPETPILLQAARELDEYFAGRRQTFDLPLNPTGTPFQRKVWAELQKIPYGTTISYGELARRIGQPKASRAVGMANHRNPLAIFIPCHRVIGADGSLTGYGGGLEVKRFLLDLEFRG